MDGEKPKHYRSYLIRCWWSAGDESSPPSVERFIVESIAEQPQRWGFDTFEDLVAFLGVTLLEREAQRRAGAPPSDAC